MSHICICNLTIVASGNGLAPGQFQAIIWTNPGILLIGPIGTNVNEILIEIHIMSFKKLHLNMSSVKWRPFCLGLNVLKWELYITYLYSSFRKPSQRYKNFLPSWQFRTNYRHNRHNHSYNRPQDHYTHIGTWKGEICTRGLLAYIAPTLMVGT